MAAMQATTKIPTRQANATQMSGQGQVLPREDGDRPGRGPAGAGRTHPPI